MQNRAGAAGLHEAGQRYGLGVEKLREERATVGVYDEKTVRVVVHADIRPFEKAIIIVEADLVGQAWIGEVTKIDFSSAVRVNTCIWRLIGCERNVELQTLTSAKLAGPAILIPNMCTNTVTTYNTRMDRHD
jgi:hypothetical protein